MGTTFVFLSIIKVLLVFAGLILTFYFLVASFKDKTKLRKAFSTFFGTALIILLLAVLEFILITI